MVLNKLIRDNYLNSKQKRSENENTRYDNIDKNMDP